MAEALLEYEGRDVSAEEVSKILAIVNE